MERKKKKGDLKFCDSRAFVSVNGSELIRETWNMHESTEKIEFI